jgi:2-iminobutanoate/2-iminopropanoate deaminase
LKENMTLQLINPTTVPTPVGPYSQATLTSAAGQFLHISGQVGMRLDGSLAEDFAGQAEATWTNLFAILDAAKMNASNLIKVVTYVTDATQLPTLGPIRLKYLGAARPASTLVVVKALAKATWLIEVEAVAFRD